ncbi:MAG: HD domain-containing protein [Anaerolineales bacterium]|nr:HD domain-containing protein [Anaerolineales bacterium]
MESSNVKNFNIFISLILQGTGACFVLFPAHLGISTKFFSAIPLGGLGLLFFLAALSIQVHSIWELPPKQKIWVDSASALLTLIGGAILFRSGQFISAQALFVFGACQIALILPIFKRLKETDAVYIATLCASFASGFWFAFSPVKTSAVIFLSVLFLAFALLGGVALSFPRLKYRAVLENALIVPWLAFIPLYVLPSGKGNLILPTTIIVAILLIRSIPWSNLAAPRGDVLSPRMMALAATTEIGLLLFLGALLFAFDLQFAEDSALSFTLRGLTFAFFILASIAVYIGAMLTIMTASRLMRALNQPPELEAEEDSVNERLWDRWLEKYIAPYIMTPSGARWRVQADRINALVRQSALEKKRNAQLALLLELSQQLENSLDAPVSAQIAANTLERALNCGLVLFFTHEPEKREIALLAATGKQSRSVPIEYRQPSGQGIVGRALRQRKTQIVDSLRPESDFLFFKDKAGMSAVVVPLLHNGYTQGALIIANDQPNTFNNLDVTMAETVAAELIRAWERAKYSERLRQLIQSGSQLSSMSDPETAVWQVALISREIVQAKFAYIYIQLGQGANEVYRASSGKAPKLLASLQIENLFVGMISLAMRSSKPFRLRDSRRYEATAQLTLDNNQLRSLLVIPIRRHHVNIGAIFAFGKQNEAAFAESDEALADLISIQAGGALESAWLQQELRSSLRIASLLYRLSNQILQSEHVENAAADIAQTAHELSNNLATGIVLFDGAGEAIAKVLIGAEETPENSEHPFNLIQEAIDSGQTIYLALNQTLVRACYPIQTSIRKYGAIWMDSIDEATKPSAKPSDVQALVNQAAIALERSLLLAESKKQAQEIKDAYDTLEETYDQTLASLTAALDARDQETEGHSVRVAKLAVQFGKSLGYSPQQIKILERGSMLHDIGKIGISDAILLKPGALTEEEWKIMRLHPDIGARIVEGIPFLEETIPLIRHHQERWDGSGYPDQLKARDIPDLARMFSIVDTFDALTNKRPYRQKISAEEALGYLKEKAGAYFDPQMVAHFEALIKQNPQMAK